MHLIHIISGGLSAAAIGRNATPNLVLHDEHTELFHLLAQLFDVIADDSVVDIHVGAVVEQIQRAFDVDFQRGGNVVGFFFILLEQGVVEIFQNRHIFRAGVSEIFPIDKMHTAVNDRLFHREQTFFAANNQLTQREDKVCFQRQGVIFFAVIAVNIHRVDELGAVGRDFNDLTFQTIYQRRILSLWVIDDNIIIGHEKCVCDFTFCTERFARAGSAEDKAVGILEPLSVHHDQITGKRIQTIVQALFAGLVKLLCGKRNENGRGTGGKAALNLDLAVSQRQRGHKPLLLLIIQPTEIAVMLLRDGACLKDVVFQLLLSPARIQYQKCDEEHSLILALQLFEQVFGISTVSFQI